MPTAKLTVFLAAITAAWLAPIPPAARERYRNRDGSCVQCSIACCGAIVACPQASTVYTDSENGAAIHGGSDPTRVQQYCADRHIPIYNKTGPQSTTWIRWAIHTGRPAACTWGPNHMIAIIGTRRKESEIALWDNNSPRQLQWLTWTQFTKQHAPNGYGWCVIISYPPAPGKRPQNAWDAANSDH